MIYNLGLFSDIGFSILQALRTLAGRIAAILYNFIVDIYNVFMYISRAEILEESFVKGIYTRVGMILGIFMVFKLSFSLIQTLIEPDKLNDKKTGYANIIMRSIIAIVLLGTTPRIFRAAFDLQNVIVGTTDSNNNVIYRFIVGNAVTEDAATFGHTIATDLFFSFYREQTEGALDQGIEVLYDPDHPENPITLAANNFSSLKSKIRTGELDFSDTVDYLPMRKGGRYLIKWDEIFSLGTAIIVIYILITYCLQVAARVIQLAYLQIVAPIPILSYISDPEGTFKNWVKQCLTTYLDLFLRLAIIYFVITVAVKILGQFDQIEQGMGNILSNSTGLTSSDSAFKWVKVFLVLGLLVFGKKVPDLLKELFPNMGGGAASFDFGLKKPKDLISSVPIAGAAVGYGLNKAGKIGKWGAKKVGHAAAYLPKKGMNRLKDETSGRWNTFKSEFNGRRLNEEGADAFSGEFAESYREKKAAQRAVEEAQIRAKSANTPQEKAARERELIEAQNRLTKAKERHEMNRKKYVTQAAREDRMKNYATRHDLSSTSSPAPSSNEARREQIRHNIAQMQNQKPSHFTAEEKAKEAERRANERSSYNDDRQAELASQSIFSDDEAMRQSDIDHNLGIDRQSASTEGAPTAENSIFNDDEAMRQSDLDYNNAQNNNSNNNDAREYQNGDDVGE